MLYSKYHKYIGLKRQQAVLLLVLGIGKIPVLCVYVLNYIHAKGFCLFLCIIMNYKVDEVPYFYAITNGCTFKQENKKNQQQYEFIEFIARYNQLVRETSPEFFFFPLNSPLLHLILCSMDAAASCHKNSSERSLLFRKFRYMNEICYNLLPEYSS